MPARSSAGYVVEGWFRDGPGGTTIFCGNSFRAAVTEALQLRSRERASGLRGCDGVDVVRTNTRELQTTDRAEIDRWLAESGGSAPEHATVEFTYWAWGPDGHGATPPGNTAGGAADFRDVLDRLFSACPNPSRLHLIEEHRVVLGSVARDGTETWHTPRFRGTETMAAVRQGRSHAAPGHDVSQG